MGQFSSPVATHSRTNEVEVPPRPEGTMPIWVDGRCVMRSEPGRCGDPIKINAPGGHSITKHTGGGGWLEGLNQKPQTIYPKIAILKNAKIIPPKYS